MNTYGLMSINVTTFNTQKDCPLRYPKEIRDKFVTGLRIHNGILNVLGYIPVICTFSGSIRILTGAALWVISQKEGHLSTDTPGTFIGRWFVEAQSTAIAQIARGIFEAFCPYGHYINVGLDLVGTIINPFKSFVWEIDGPTPHAHCYECMNGDSGPHTHNGGTFAYQNPNYPFFLKPLLLV